MKKVEPKIKSNYQEAQEAAKKLGQNENCPSKNSSRCLELSREIIKVRLDQNY